MSVTGRAAGLSLAAVVVACAPVDDGSTTDARECGPSAEMSVSRAVTHFHGDATRQGSFAGVPASVVRDPAFGSSWRSEALDDERIGGVVYPPLIYASPLYVEGVELSTARYRGAVDIAITATSNGWIYAIATRGDDECGVRPGEIVWRRRLVTATPIEFLDQGVPMGVLSTPVIDLQASPPQIFVAAHDVAAGWQIFALELASGEPIAGWPVGINDAALAPINTNGPARFHASSTMSQRGALQLSPAGDRVYAAFGTYWGTGVGWIVAVDTRAPQLVGAFSAAPWSESSSNGGMWGSAGPAVDDQGRVWVTTGNSPPGTGDAPSVWGSSLLQLSAALELERAYSPFNYCVLDDANMDLGASQPLLLDPLEGASTPNTIAFGGKQGVVYLVDADSVAVAGASRGACSGDSASDSSLLPPAPQPQFGARGPLSVFGPYSDVYGQVEHAKMRTKLVSWTDGQGRRVLFASGSSKASASSTETVAPSIAKLIVEADDGGPAYLRIDRYNPDVVMKNPGSPIVSGAAEEAVVWVLDRNAPRLAGLLDPATPGPILYAFDAETLALLWRSEPLASAGKYASPIVAGDVVMVGTDRLEAFGINQGDGAPE